MKHCMVVDDSDVIRKVARRILEKMNFQISEAENGQDAMEKIHNKMPDAILLDWQMPVMGAFEFLGALRLGNFPTKPYIIYCATENDPADISRAMSAGADDYILKPFDRETITVKMIEAGFQV